MLAIPRRVLKREGRPKLDEYGSKKMAQDEECWKGQTRKTGSTLLVAKSQGFSSSILPLFKEDETCGHPTG